MATRGKELDEELDKEPHTVLVAPQVEPRHYEVVYSKVLQFGYLHLAGLYGLYLCFTAAKWQTLLFEGVLCVCALEGVTAGAHRLWSHRAYKAKMPLQILLMLFQSLAVQTPVINWARDHRLHHKFSDTDADPHNSRRGFFYSHFGWMLVKKHPEAVKQRTNIDVTDIYANSVLQFQKKYYVYLIVLLAFVLPTFLPVYFWHESLNTAYHVSIFRIIVEWNVIFLINSAAHKYGNKPYDKHISPTQSVTLSLATLGECYHNYHHTFPFDYRTSELGNNRLNFTTNFIDFFVWVGWAYDLKQATPDMIVKRSERTGDGTDLWGRMKQLDKKERFDEFGTIN